MKYRTIVADPPWQVGRSCGGYGYSQGERGPRELDYPTLSLTEIAALRVGRLAADEAHLYLWTTSAWLRKAYWVAEVWGFEPSATLVWAKPAGGFVGGTFYPNVEFVIFARRGVLASAKAVNSRWFTWPRAEHSVKPEAFLDLVEQISPGPYLELFARRQRIGWDTWGDEALEHVELSA